MSKVVPGDDMEQNNDGIMLCSGSNDPEIGGLCCRSLMSHKPGERFVYEGEIFTRVVFSESFAMWLHYGCFIEKKQIETLQESFIAVDQFGVLNILTREENVITVNTFPMWGSFHRTHPNGFPDANEILVKKNASWKADQQQNS